MIRKHNKINFALIIILQCTDITPIQYFLNDLASLAKTCQTGIHKKQWPDWLQQHSTGAAYYPVECGEGIHQMPYTADCVSKQ